MTAESQLLPAAAPTCVACCVASILACIVFCNFVNIYKSIYISQGGKSSLPCSIMYVRTLAGTLALYICKHI